MQGGKLRTKITVQEKTDTISDSGQAVSTFSTFRDIYADIRTPSGREFFGQDKFNATVSHVVTIRWLEGIKPEMRILWGTRILNIIYINEDRQHARMMQLNCMEARN
jgi:SPP1 family predicted phage head-tail adaptor